MSVKVNFQLHGVLIRLAGCEALSIDCPSRSSVDHALALLADREPALQEALNQTACAIGEALVSRDTILQGDTQIALIPPVSGG